jgi:hypothetical protein
MPRSKERTERGAKVLATKREKRAVRNAPLAGLLSAWMIAGETPQPETVDAPGLTISYGSTVVHRIPDEIMPAPELTAEFEAARFDDDGGCVVIPAAETVIEIVRCAHGIRLSDHCGQCVAAVKKTKKGGRRKAA